MEKLVLENEYQNGVPLFGAAFAAPNKGTTQFYTDFDLYHECEVLQKIDKFKAFSRPSSSFPVLFNAGLIFKDFSRISKAL